MRPISKGVLWKILLLVAVLLISFAGFSQWQRHQAEKNYQALLALKNTDQSRLEDMENNPLSAVDHQDGVGEGYAFQYRENPAKEWLNINPDYMGWITIENTNINYPYVRSKDNEDYLERDFYRQKSVAGAIFMDYRNLGNFNDSHTILYGHNMKSRTMFHQLNNYEDKAFFEGNPVIEISGHYETKTFQVFSAYEVSADEYIFQMSFQDQEDYHLYLKSIAALSLHIPAFELDPNQRLLTLATCSYGVDNGRFVVHALEI